MKKAGVARQINLPFCDSLKLRRGTFSPQAVMKKSNEAMQNWQPQEEGLSVIVFGVAPQLEGQRFLIPALDNRTH